MRHWVLLIAWASTAGIVLATLRALATVRPVLISTWVLALLIMLTPAMLTLMLQKFWKNKGIDNV